MFVAAVCAATALLPLACSKGGGEAAAARPRPAPLVVVSKVMARDVPIEVRAPVELRPIAQADVGSKTLGILDAVLVDRGDRVKRGQLVALVRPSDLPDQLAAARGTLAQIQASVALARTNFQRAEKLAPSGVVSQQELSNATGALAQAEASQSAALAQASALAVRLGETRIEAPMDGLVSVRRLDPGAIVGPPGGGAIVTIVRIDTLRVFVTVTERELTGIKVGQEAHVELEALPGRSILGKVVRIAPTLDPTTRTLDAEVQLPNPKEELRPGMFGHGSIVVDMHPHVAILPAVAVQISDNKRYVYVLVGEKVQRRLVETGVDEGTWLEVKSGVAAGEEIVTAGIDNLSDGALVRVTRDVDPYTGSSGAEGGPSAAPAATALPPASAAPPASK